MDEFYLDAAATTNPTDAALGATIRAMTATWGNANSLHRSGIRASEAVQIAREHVAALIDADPSQIFFTSGASESNTQAILGLADHLRAAGKMHIVTTQVEHASILSAMKQMERMGFSVSYLPVNANCELNYSDFLAALRPDTGLVSVMCVNNETGAIFPCANIGKRCHRLKASSRHVVN